MISGIGTLCCRDAAGVCPCPRMFEMTGSCFEGVIKGLPVDKDAGWIAKCCCIEVACGGIGGALGAFGRLVIPNDGN